MGHGFDLCIRTGAFFHSCLFLHFHQYNFLDLGSTSLGVIFKFLSECHNHAKLEFLTTRLLITDAFCSEHLGQFRPIDLWYTDFNH